MTTIDGVASLVILLVLAALVWVATERIYPSDKTSEGLGYMPDSEAPECGWTLAILCTAVVIAIFIGLFGYVGSAVFLG